MRSGEVRDEGDLTAWDLRGFDDWLSGRADATRKAYASDLLGFAQWMGRGDVTRPDAVERLHLRRYLASLGTRRLARATVARMSAATAAEAAAWMTVPRAW